MEIFDYDKINEERLRALENRDAQAYARLCHEYGMSLDQVEDPLLFEQAQKVTETFPEDYVIESSRGFERTPQRKLRSLEELCVLIREKLENFETVEGRINCNIKNSRGGIFGNRVYDFLGKKVEERCSYDNSSQFNQDSISDGIANMKFYLDSFQIVSKENKIIINIG